MTFLPNGKMDPGYTTWTNGLVLHAGNKTASKYEIKKIDGAEYMFFEWKSGDYTFGHMKPSYYVLQRDLSSDVATTAPTAASAPN